MDFYGSHEIYNLQLNADLICQRVRDWAGQRDQGRGADRADARIYVLRRAARGRESVECRRFGDGRTDEAFLSAHAQRRMPAGAALRAASA